MSAAMSLLEQDLIKLLIIAKSFVELTGDIKDSAFVSEAGNIMYNRIMELAPDSRQIDIDKLIEGFDEETSRQFDAIKDKVIPQGREMDIFNECIERIRKRNLKAKESHIIMQLSMADEEDNHEEIVRLTRQLMEIQKKIRE